jgi:hypothetical protein
VLVRDVLILIPEGRKKKAVAKEVEKLSNKSSDWNGQFCWTGGDRAAALAAKEPPPDGAPYNLSDAFADKERRNLYRVCGAAARAIVSHTGMLILC